MQLPKLKIWEKCRGVGAEAWLGYTYTCTYLHRGHPVAKFNSYLVETARLSGGRLNELTKYAVSDSVLVDSVLIRKIVYYMI